MVLPGFIWLIRVIACVLLVVKYFSYHCCFHITWFNQTFLVNSKFLYTSLKHSQIINRSNTICVHAQSLQSCQTQGNSMDYSQPGSSVHGILQSKNTGVGCHTLLTTWHSSWESSWPRDWTHNVCCIFCIIGEFFTAEPPRKPSIQHIQS